MEITLIEGSTNKQTLLLVETSTTIEPWIWDRLKKDNIIKANLDQDFDLNLILKEINLLNPRQLSLIAYEKLAGVALNLAHRLPVRRLLLVEPDLFEFGIENHLNNRLLRIIDKFIPFGLPLIRYKNERVPSWQHHRIRCPILVVGQQNLSGRFPNITNENLLTPDLLDRFLNLSFKCPVKKTGAHGL